MKTQQISYRELAALSKVAQKIAAFQAVLSVIPDSGCRLFINYERSCINVIDDNGQPMFFPSVESALAELAMLPGIDHHVTVDIISLLPRVIPCYRVLAETGKRVSYLLG